MCHLTHSQLTRTSITSRLNSKFGACGVFFFFHLSSHRLGMGHVVTTQAPTFLMESSSFFQVTIKCMQALISSNFGQKPPLTPESERLTYNDVRLFILNGSSAFIQVTTTTIKLDEFDTPLYSRTGVYRGKLIFALKHRLWVLVRTAFLRRFYVLSKNKKRVIFS